jgi:hypothetical protein
LLENNFNVVNNFIKFFLNSKVRFGKHYFYDVLYFLYITIYQKTLMSCHTIKLIVVFS